MGLGNLGALCLRSCPQVDRRIHIAEKAAGRNGTSDDCGSTLTSFA